VRAIERAGAESFEGNRLSRMGVWAVEFTADWCPFCREFAPRFASLSLSGAHALIADLTDLASPLWESFRIEVVPTVLVFRDGEEIARADGIPGEGLYDSHVRAIESALAEAMATPNRSRQTPSRRSPRGPAR
jgi:thioredoxin 1